jgi:D-alanyl-D-alanine carboxypeptidase
VIRFRYALAVVGLSAAAQMPEAEARSSQQVLNQILRTYPTTTSVLNGKLLVQGKLVEVGSAPNPGDFDERMNKANLVDQLAIEYPKGCPVRPPGVGKDPGRLRSDSFFRTMYGATSGAVRRNLVNVDWFGSPMQVTSINGVDDQLRQVARELKGKPDLVKYLENPGGSFTWRPIAGTKLQSAHSFGIAVDINTKFSDYWRWKDATKVAPYVNRIPCEIAEVFERHGFIWGAKWWHFDTMHFEYRPELL